jgi:nucleoside-diphosphate-sugar epimerase
MTNVFRWIEQHHLMFSFISTQLAGFPNAYGITKMAAEYWASQLDHGLIARLWNCYGAEEIGIRSHVIPDLIAQARAARWIDLKTSGEELRQFLHADDVAQALIAQRNSGQAFADITSGVWVSIREIAEIVARQMSATATQGKEKGSESLVEPSRPLMGWSPSIDLEQGIALVIRETQAMAPLTIET